MARMVNGVRTCEAWIEGRGGNGHDRHWCLRRAAVVVAFAPNEFRGVDRNAGACEDRCRQHAKRVGVRIVETIAPGNRTPSTANPITFTVRPAGCTAWATGLPTLRKAREAARKALDAGLRLVSITRDEDGKQYAIWPE